MRRGHENVAGRMAKIAGALMLAGAGVLVLTQLSSLRRYLGMRSMSAKRHPQPPGTQKSGAKTEPRWGTSHWPMH